MTSMPAPGRRVLNLSAGSAGRRAMDGRSAVLGVLALTIAGAVLRFYALGHQGLWLDESYTSFLVGFSPGHMIGLIPQTESTPPLYYCVAWVWVRIFGHDAAGLRSLSAVAGVLLIPLAYGAADELLDSRRAGMVCAALTAFNPFLWWYAQEARSYELLAMLTALSLWCFARARRDPGPLRLTLWVITCALALATHYFAALLVVGEALALLCAHRRQPAVLVAVALVGACGAALIPLAISQNGTGNDSWIATEPLGLRLGQILPQFLIGTGSPARTAVKFLALALGLAGLVALVRAEPEERVGALLAGGLAVGGFAIALVLTLVGFDDILTRNLIALWLPAAICVSGGLAAVDLGRIGIALTAGLCAIGLFAIVGVLATPRLQRPQWPRLAALLGPAPAGSGRAVVIQGQPATLPLKLYLPVHKLARPTRISELQVVAMHSPPGVLCWWGAQCNLHPSTLQPRYALRGFRAVSRRRVSQFEVLTLRAAHPMTITRAAVARTLTATRVRDDALLVQTR